MTTLRFVTPALFTAIVFAMAPASEASIIVLYDTSAVTNTGSRSNFDVSTQTFAGFVADEIIDLGGESFGTLSRYHTHSGAVTHSIELKLDGVWTEVWTTGLVFSPSTPISTISTPIAFAQSTVTGFRFKAVPVVNQAWHNFNDGTLPGTQTFIEFDNSTVIPEPTTLAIWSVLGGLGLVARRRKRRKAA